MTKEEKSKKGVRKIMNKRDYQEMWDEQGEESKRKYIKRKLKYFCI